MIATILCNLFPSKCRKEGRMEVYREMINFMDTLQTEDKFVQNFYEWAVAYKKLDIYKEINDETGGIVRESPDFSIN